MADLSMTYCGVKYKNPLVLASAPPGHSGSNMRRAAEAGIGGVIPKTVCLAPIWGESPEDASRFHLYKLNGKPIGMINLDVYTNMDLNDWISRELPEAKRGGAVMHISMAGLPNVKYSAKLAKQLVDSGLCDLLEINVSCPMPSDLVGINIGKDDDLILRQIKAVKEVAGNVPVTVKLTPNTADMVKTAMLCKLAGADGLTISNTISSFAGVDIETGKPFQPSYGGYSGYAIRPVVMRHLSDVARNVDIPISATGGVNSFREIVEYVMLGASTVQVCTSVMLNGYGHITKMLTDLNDWLDQKGIKTLAELKGVALKDIVDFEVAASYEKKRAVADKAACTGCGKCPKVCFYDAIEMDSDNRSVIDAKQCSGCGLCGQVCPSGAIAYR